MLRLKQTFDNLALKPFLKPKSTNKYLIVKFNSKFYSNKLFKKPRQEIKTLEKH